jgi:hypothetical protein
VAYTYDGPTQTMTVYSDGVEANTDTLLEPLSTWAVDDQGRPLPFRLASQTDANGAATVGLRGSMTIAKLRVYGQALSGQAIADKYAAERAQFEGGTNVTDLHLELVSANGQNGAVTLSWTATAGQTYSVELSTNLTSWTAIATNLTTGTFTDAPASPVPPYKFYRLRAP